MSQREAGEPGPVTESFRGAFHAVVWRFGLLESALTPCGRAMPVSVAHALMELLGRPGVRQGELGQELGLSKSAVSRVVGQLETKGWVKRTVDEADGRAWRLELTAKGTRVARDVNSASLELFALLVEGIPASERDAVEGALGVLGSAIASTIDARGSGGDAKLPERRPAAARAIRGTTRRTSARHVPAKHAWDSSSCWRWASRSRDAPERSPARTPNQTR
ncbi:MAG: winged helix-turn-helix transcriptional regulator [Polyangiaceae bacterium]|nr:winged helix-turn-helix transcriptional regulator [Polyangiaceae bacterium]